MPCLISLIKQEMCHAETRLQVAQALSITRQQGRHERGSLLVACQGVLVEIVLKRLIGPGAQRICRFLQTDTRLRKAVSLAQEQAVEFDGFEPALLLAVDARQASASAVPGPAPDFTRIGIVTKYLAQFRFSGALLPGNDGPLMLDGGAHPRNDRARLCQ